MIVAETVAERGREAGGDAETVVSDAGRGKAAISSSHSRSEPLVHSGPSSCADTGAGEGTEETGGIGSMLRTVGEEGERAALGGEDGELITISREFKRALGLRAQPLQRPTPHSTACHDFSTHSR